MHVPSLFISCNETLYAEGAKAIALLEDAGYEAYFVGGFVRDGLLGRAQNDVDLTTNAPYERICSLFEEAGWRVLRTGEAHGTATVIEKGTSLEITRFRQDGNSRDHRHPEAVHFVETIEEDLARRDFTINALAFNPRVGLIDPFSGQADIAQKRLACVGDANERFKEDALRIVRALRFSSQLDFSLQDETKVAIFAQRQLLQTLSVERIYKEITGLLCGQNPYPVLMEYAEVLFVVLPELAPCWRFDQRTPHHLYDVYDHSAHCVAAISNTPLNRWLALLHDIGKPCCFRPDETGRGHFPKHASVGAQMIASLARRLRMPREFARDLHDVALHHDDKILLSGTSIKDMLRTLHGRPDLFASLCAMKRADIRSQAGDQAQRLSEIDALEAMERRIIESGEAFCLRDLAISGADLIEAGAKPGPAFKGMLDAALDAVIYEEVENEKNALLAFLRDKHLLA